MQKPSDNQNEKDNLRKKIIGLGDCSLRKSYYTQLQDQVDNLERSREDLVEAIKRAETSENLLRALFDNTIDGIVLADVESKKLTTMNRAMLSLLGTDDPEADLYVDDIHPEDKLPYVHTQFSRLAEGKIKLVRNIPLKRRDGSVLYVDISGTPILINGRKYISAVFRDMTEPRRAAIEKSELESRIYQMQKMEAIGTLAGGVAHDFNNILTAIMGLAELSVRATTQGEPVRRYTEQILASCHRARDLVSQLLSISYKSEKQQEPVKLIPVIKDGIGLIRATLPSTVEIRTEIEAEFDYATADSTQISRIVMNLCTNAAQSMRNMQGEIIINVSNSFVDDKYASSHPDLKKGLYLLLKVADNGSGIEPAIIERIFEPFFTTKERGKGTGLGLAVIHGIVKNHGGSIYVYSKPGEGSTFEVYLPVSEYKNEVTVNETEIPVTGHALILLVDDEEMLTEVNGSILETLGYSVTACSSGAEALRIFSDKPEAVDLVITDMTMPGMTGLDLASEIKKIKPGIPVILCTGFSEQLTKEKAEETGICDIVMKPFTAAELGHAVQRGLMRS
ncbi:MAG TPA: response regulator [Spirochaetota bacterium]|nr:response regulator [Spirochaetota bacterium]HRX47488.1 response regulator [Spirochaetota bacterium]